MTEMTDATALGRCRWCRAAVELVQLRRANGQPLIQPTSSSHDPSCPARTGQVLELADAG